MQIVSHGIAPVRPVPSLLRSTIGFMGSTVALTSLLVFLSAL
jgi:hypothetical protein